MELDVFSLNNINGYICILIWLFFVLLYLDNLQFIERNRVKIKKKSKMHSLAPGEDLQYGESGEELRPPAPPTAAFYQIRRHLPWSTRPAADDRHTSCRLLGLGLEGMGRGGTTGAHVEDGNGERRSFL
jgi:hypothetical protein